MVVIENVRTLTNVAVMLSVVTASGWSPICYLHYIRDRSAQFHVFLHLFHIEAKKCSLFYLASVFFAQAPNKESFFRRAALLRL